MARRSNNANGVHVNSDAPPASTIAAQIVQNQTRPAATQHSGEQAIFKQLLQEILHNPNTEQETDVNINAQLVGIVVEAGLLGLATENPFANWDELRAQAVDSIHVIQATIQRQPEVLLASPSHHGPPVLLSLLATLVSICGKVKFHSSPVVELLDTSIRALQASVDLWHHANHLREVIQACVDDLLSALEIAPNGSSISDVKLPPVRSVRKIWSDAESSIAIPPGSSTLVNEPIWAFVLSLQLCQTYALNKFWRQNAHARCERLLLKLRPQLQKTKQWDDAITYLLRTDDNQRFLASLINGMRKQSLSPAIQSAMATSLLTALNGGRQILEILLPSCRDLLEGESVDGVNEDLRAAMATLVPSTQHDKNLLNRNVALSHSADEENLTFTNGIHNGVVRRSTLQRVHRFVTPPQRRQTVSIQVEGSQEESTVKRLTELLTGVESHDLSAIQNNVSIPYNNLSEIQQCAVWQYLIELIPHSSDAKDMTSNLLENGNLHRNKKPRVLSLLATGVYVQHSADPYRVSLGASQYGRFCLQALHSSLRELRIAAGQTLPVFLRDTLPDDIKNQNRQVAIEYLRTVSDRNVTSEQETLVAAWTQVGLACSEKEMNLVLLRLVQYLGHANSLICALAFSEIEKIAGVKSMSVEALFSPFWRTIAISVVQDLHVKPQKAQQVCDLIGKDVNSFLTLTQREILPTLVLSKNHAILRRLAEARGKDSTVRQVCMQPIANLAGIITLLLNHFGPGGEEAAFACLLEIDADFRQTDLSDLVEIDAGVIACEMLLHCGDQDEAKKPRSHQAFYMLVSLSERSPGQRKASSKTPPRTIASFFEKHILGILTHFSTVLVSGPEAQSLHEKARCLRGIEEMFKLAKGQVSFALPQIRACLQSGLDQAELRDIAFGAWLSLIPVLDDDDIVQIVDETFALVLRHWSSLNLDLQKRTHDLIAGLVKTHNLVLQEKITTLPALDGIPVLSKFAAEFGRLRSQENVESRCKAFAQRLQVDSDTVVFQAITELVPFLERNQDFLHETAASEHPAPVLSELLRALLDVTVKYAHTNSTVAYSCGKALGIIGCLDPNRVETVRKKREVLLLSNFDKADEVVEWVIALFEDVLVKAFKSVTNARAQGFLAYAMQELLKSCNFTELSALRSRSSQATGTHQRWIDMPEHIRTTLTPFLTSRYLITSASAATPPNRIYPSFSVYAGHGRWLRNLTADLVLKAKGDNANIVFPLFLRLVRTQDLSIARWIFPYICLNIVLGGTVAEVKGLSDEFLAVLEAKPTNSSEEETVRLCSDNVFAVLDYMTSWLREKSKTLAETRVAAYKTGNTPADFDEEKDMAQIETVEQFLASIPAVVIANQAMECRSYARALFHWEQHIREKGPLIPSARQNESKEGLYERLMDIYAQIEEPDGLEGISAHLPIVTEQQRATNHAKAGRWTAAQAWYELQLSEDSHDTELQNNLLNCLGETGQFGSLLKYVDSFLTPKQEKKSLDRAAVSHISRAVEACWMTENFRGLETYLQLDPPEHGDTFNIGVGRIVVHAVKQERLELDDRIAAMRISIAEALSTAGTESLQTCHDEMKRLHVLYEVESLMSAPANTLPQVWDTLNKRLAAVGSYVQDKQYILGLRRTIMRIKQETFRITQTGALWVNTAKLARQAKNTSFAYNAVLKAVQCGNREAVLEEARLLWHEGHQRQAIQSLDSAIQSGLFDEVETEADVVMDGSAAGMSVSADRVSGHLQNKLSAKAYLLLAKWLDASGQSQTNDMTERYQMAARRFQRWEKGHYYLGKHYSKLLDAQKALPKEKRSQAFLTGEMTKLVVDNNLRSIPFGNKYWHETIPRLFTLWLELGSDIERKAPREDPSIVEKRIKSLQACNKQMQKYFERVPPYVFYHALPQLISRITHPHPDIWKQVCNILTRIVSTHPSQALWSLLAVIKARDRLRVERGMEVLNRVKDPKNRAKPDTPGLDLRVMIQQGQRLSEGLLQACEIPVDPRTTSVNLFTDLNFNHKLAPSSLVVPIESTLTASSLNQATSDDIRKHKAFTQDKITIQSFRENVMVLSSLQRPRKITLRGSDGKDYGLLCKPKDDLRKDQRLMEFNGIINRALKRNTESSKRRLYIKTYAVTPLSEESGTIEWVEGIKPMRDILLNIYSRKGTRPNYNEIRKDLEAACAGPEHAHLFAEKILVKFPPSLHEWFSGNYPQPDRWFAARLRYARSAAVMSMTGHILGLGDRHGENILLEESTGGVFHVDFNCLFDKGLTFDKPELVPFRLTHNMVDAMGPYGHEGPFRKSSELTLNLLRQERDTLMTILETFLYDPTTDFVGKKKRSTAGVPETPAEILESVATKLRGLLRGETVPLSVEGHVDALIQEATDPFRLASMYIGWCSFL